MRPHRSKQASERSQPSQSARISLEEFELDPANECLWLRETAIALRPKVYALLSYLTQNPSRIVTKAELLDEIWPDAVVGDAVLKVCIRELRKALSDSTAEPRFIQTVHRRGYCFLIESAVEEQPENAASSDRLSQPTNRRSEFVGREHELQQLHGWLAESDRGSRKLIFLEGEPGLGKTALIRAFATSLERDSDLWVSSGQCLDQHGPGEAYLPILDALAGLLRGPAQESLTEVLQTTAPTWVAHLPIESSKGSERAGHDPEVFGVTPARMLREMAEALEVMSADRTLLLCLEDLHWADPSTVDLIAAIARRNGPARLMILATLRPLELPSKSHPLKGVLQSLSAHGLVHQVPLGLLEPDQTQALIAERLKSESLPAGLPTGLAQWAHARTEGNPLFLINLIDSLRSRGVLSPVDGGFEITGKLEDNALPTNIAGLIDDMVGRRPAPEQAVLEAASIAGRDFSSAALAAILIEDQFELEELCDRLCASSHFLVRLESEQLPDGTRAQRYGFRHELFARALVDRIPAGRRSRYHARNAERGAIAYGDRVVEIAAELALEYEQGGRPAQSLRLLRVAAQESVRRCAYREASAHLNHALKLAAALEEPASSQDQIELYEQLGLLLRASGDLIGAANAFARMAALATNVERLEDAARALLYEASAASWIDRARCLRAVNEAAALSGQLPSGFLPAHVQGAVGYWNLLWETRRQSDADACDRARLAAKQDGQPVIEALHTVRLAWFHWLGGHYRAAVETARDGVALALQNGDAYEYLLGQYFLAWALLHAGEWGDLRRVLNESLDMATRNEHNSWLVLFRLLESWLHLEAGDFVGARTMAEGARVQAVELGNSYPELLADTILGLAYQGAEEERKALDCFARVRSKESSQILMSWALAMIATSGCARSALGSGDLKLAESEARALAETAERIGERTAASVARRTLAEVALAHGDETRAKTELEAALEHLEGEAAPIAAWRVYLAAAEIFGSSDPEKRASFRARAAAELRNLANSLSELDPLRETVLARATRL